METLDENTPMDTDTSTPTPQTLNIKGHVQNYDWGKKGKDSIISTLIDNVSPEIPYSELWFGCHPNGPAIVYETGKTLEETIGHPIPFLLKVLSIQTKAAQLHEQNPFVYRDSNHKPEMVIALTDFYALSGFRDINSIISLMNNNPAFRSIFSEETLFNLKSNPCKETLHAAFSEYIKNENPESLALLAKQYCSVKKPSFGSFTYWLKTLLELYPGDWGVFCIFFMNNVYLEPGQSLFIKENQLHAYLLGDCIECMACSDNVVRAGLTNKFKDINTLLEIVDCTPNSPQIDSGNILDYDTVEYICPTFEFALESIVTEKVYPLKARDSESIMLIIEGDGKLKDESRIVEIGRGSAVYIPPGETFWLESKSGFIIVRCFVPTKIQ
jgi:mannose-6-phosphate isomerase